MIQKEKWSDIMEIQNCYNNFEQIMIELAKEMDNFKKAKRTNVKFT